MKLIQGDCLVEMQNIPSGSVDLILTDPPYGTTACKWDTIIPFDLMWEQLNRIIKPNGAIVMTASQPFTSALIMSNIKMFRYEWIWVKTKASNFQNARKMPMKRHENICVFYNYLPQYNHNAVKLSKPKLNSRKNKGANLGHCVDSGNYYQKDGGFPTTDIYFSNPSGKGQLHPTQKPVALMEYLIKTYTNENETVLDFTMGSGTTGVACKNLNRDFIGIELDKEYFEIAKKRIENHVVQTELF